MVALQVLLIIFPIVVYKLTRIYITRHIYKLSLSAFGAIVAPFGFGLYSLAFLTPLGVCFGVVGLILIAVHDYPAWLVAHYLGLSGVGGIGWDPWLRFLGNILDAIAWGIVYGLIGWLIDRRRTRKASSQVAKIHCL